MTARGAAGKHPAANRRILSKGGPSKTVEYFRSNVDKLCPPNLPHLENLDNFTQEDIKNLNKLCSDKRKAKLVQLVASGSVDGFTIHRIARNNLLPNGFVRRTVNELSNYDFIEAMGHRITAKDKLRRMWKGHGSTGKGPAVVLSHLGPSTPVPDRLKPNSPTARLYMSDSEEDALKAIRGILAAHDTDEGHPPRALGPTAQKSYLPWEDKELLAFDTGRSYTR